MPYPKSHQLFAEAKKHLVGGVNSAVRAFGGVGGEPIFVRLPMWMATNTLITCCHGARSCSAMPIPEWSKR